MTELTKSQTKPGSSISFGHGGIQIRSLEDAQRFCNLVYQSTLCPKNLDSPQKIFVALQHGLEVGLGPMQAIQQIYIINNRPNMFGDALLALLRHPRNAAVWDENGWSESYFGEGDDYGCCVTMKRRNAKKGHSVNYTIKKAKLARLWGKQGPWTNDPDRMLMWRARWFCARDLFAEILCGIGMVEVARDESPEVTDDEPLRGTEGVKQYLMDSKKGAPMVVCNRCKAGGPLGFEGPGPYYCPNCSAPIDNPDDTQPAEDAEYEGEDENASETPEATDERFSGGSLLC